MRKTKIISFITFIGALFLSCDKCDNLDCLADNYYGQFRIVRATDGKDLVFGPDKVYDKDQIIFYSLNGSDTTFFEYQTIRFPNTGYDSILSVLFLPKADIGYMRLSNGDIDTLNISYNTFNTKCCGTITEIKNFKLNNLVDILGDQGTQVIQK
jgi:hypothetical protein